MRAISGLGRWLSGAVLGAGLLAANPLQAQVMQFLEVPTAAEVLETLMGPAATVPPGTEGTRMMQPETARILRERPDLPGGGDVRPAPTDGSSKPVAARRPPRPRPPTALAFADNFRLGSAELPPKTMALLDSLAGAMKQEASLTVLVSGHTDTSGGAAINARLSLQRAENARKYLVEHGAVAAARIAVLGAGASQPMPGTDPGAAENRRIQLVRVAS